jgi:hypothetical protein
MIKNWDELILKATPFIQFLSRDSYFKFAYSGTINDCIVLIDAAVARHFATDDSFDDFDEWVTVSYAPDVLRN